MRLELRLCAVITLVALVVGGCKDQSAADTAQSATQPKAGITSSATASSTAAPSSASSSLRPKVDLLPEAKAQPLLWVVEGAAGKTYLFGTMLLGADAERQLNPVVWDSVGEAGTMVMELDVGTIDTAKLLAAAMLPEGESLDEKLGADRWSKLVKLVGTVMPEAGLRRVKPWFAMVALTQSLLPSGPAMDLVMHDRAKKAGKTMEYLETIDVQIKMFEETMTVALLKDAIDELTKQKTLVIDMQKAYLSGDVATLESVVFDPVEMKKHPKVFERTFEQRNKNWLPKVTQYAKEGSAFIAVGAGHWLSDKGLLKMLEDKGIKAKRIDVGTKPKP